jgi:hypothetical protein
MSGFGTLGTVHAAVKSSPLACARSLGFVGCSLRDEQPTRNGRATSANMAERTPLARRTLDVGGMTCAVFLLHMTPWQAGFDPARAEVALRELDEEDSERAVSVMLNPWMRSALVMA